MCLPQAKQLPRYVRVKSPVTLYTVLLTCIIFFEFLIFVILNVPRNTDDGKNHNRNSTFDVCRSSKTDVAIPGNALALKN